MRTSLFIVSMILALSAHAADQRIYQTDSVGNVQYHKPTYNIEKSGRIVETDSVGNKLYHRSVFFIKEKK